MNQIFHKILIVLLIPLFFSSANAQRTYHFNVPGNVCYFQFVNYCPDGDYRSYTRPFVFVLGKPGQSANEIYEADSLKFKTQFYSYCFVYVPSRGASDAEKLYCLDAFVTHQTNRQACGKHNIFLYSYDASIQDYSSVSRGLNRVFESIRVADPAVSTEQDSIPSLEQAFQARAPEEEVAVDEVGTFYIDEEVEEEESRAAQAHVAKKSYFGPPETFDYSLNGRVVDHSTGEVLPYALVKVNNTNLGANTNADGLFTLHKVPSDTSVLLVSYVGYTPAVVYLTPSSPKRNFVVGLRPSTNTLKTVTLLGLKEDVVLSKKEDVSVIKMTPRQIEKLPSLGEKDVLRSFQLMPGVSASQESSSGLYVRGGTPDQNLILFDGFTVYHVDHLYGFFSAFNSNALKDVQLYKGGFESRFGGRLSSVTEITSKDGNQKKFRAGADLSLLSLNAFVEVPIGEKFSSILAYRRSYKGPIYNKLFEKFNQSESSEDNGAVGGPPGGGGFGQESAVSNYFYDLNAKFTYRPSEKDLLSWSLFNGTDKLDNSSSFSAPSFGASNAGFSDNSTDLTKYGNIGTSLRWARKWTGKLYGNTILSYSNYYSDRDRSQERTRLDSNDVETTVTNGVFENNDLKDFSLKSDYQWDWASFGQLQFGGFATYYDIDYTYAQNDTTTVLDKQNQSLLAGGFLQNRFKLLGSRLTFTPGIRSSYFETTGQFYLEPRSSLTLSLSDKISLKGAYGQYYQFANRVTREDILSGSRDFWLLSDGHSIPVSSSIHYIAGLSYETDHYLFSAEAYYKEVDNITEYSLRFNPRPDGVSYEENFFTGSSIAKGIEFLAQKKVGDLSGWLSYTIGEARNRFEVYSDVDYPANQDVTHEFKAVAMYEYKRWNFSASWVFATGRPYTAPSGAYTVELLDGSTQDYFTVTTKNGLRLPNYHRGDISANYKLLSGSAGERKRREIGYLGLSIFNLYNRTNVWYKTYTIEEGSLIETNVTYTGLTPNLTLSLKLW